MAPPPPSPPEARSALRPRTVGLARLAWPRSTPSPGPQPHEVQPPEGSRPASAPLRPLPCESSRGNSLRMRTPRGQPSGPGAGVSGCRGLGQYLRCGQGQGGVRVGWVASPCPGRPRGLGSTRWALQQHLWGALSWFPVPGGPRGSFSKSLGGVTRRRGIQRFGGVPVLGHVGAGRAGLVAQPGRLPSWTMTALFIVGIRLCPCPRQGPGVPAPRDLGS